MLPDVGNVDVASARHRQAPHALCGGDDVVELLPLRSSGVSYNMTYACESQEILRVCASTLCYPSSLLSSSCQVR